MAAGGAAGVVDQTQDSFSEIDDENSLLSTLASGTDSVELLVDYSDFANFVTFNSAESYVTVTADQILNGWPRGGSADELQRFTNGLDGYQRYFLANWPSRTGHLRFNPAVSSSYVRFDDVGVVDGAAKSSLLSPGTGSVSIQGWLDVPALTGTESVQVVFQKLLLGSADGYTVFCSGSRLFFNVSSGSASTTVSASISERPFFFAAVLDRSVSTGSVFLYAGTTGSYPTRSDDSSIVLGSRFDLASGSFYIGSGSVAGKTVIPFTGSVDSVSAWSVPRTLVNLTGTYNRKIYSQPGLVGLWRFSDATPSTALVASEIVRDSSGHRLDGRIQRHFSGVLGSGSLDIDSPDPILSLDDPDVVDYVIEARVSGSEYDRNNRSLIFNLFPEAFSQGDPTSVEVFRNFALIMARNFDRIKLYIAQFVNLRRVEYGDYDQSPDELLDLIGRFFGWDLQGSFATTDAMRYFVGRSVQPGPAGNSSLDTKLSEVKAEFWRRVLLNLSYMYKTKGTRESVEALLRSYGVDNGFVRLKEYARKTETTIEVERVPVQKSVYALRFCSGSSVTYTAPAL